MAVQNKSVFKATENKNGVFKATKNRSYDPWLLKNWQSTNKTSSDTLNQYSEKINNGGYISSDDLKSYKKAVDDYISTSNNLRNVSRTYGTVYTDEQEKEWQDTVNALNSNYDAIQKYYSSFGSETDMKEFELGWVEDNSFSEDRLSARKEQYQKNIEEIARLEQKYQNMYGTSTPGFNRSGIDNTAEKKALKAEIDVLKASNARYELGQKVIDDYYVPQTEEFKQNAAQRDYVSYSRDDLEKFATYGEGFNNALKATENGFVDVNGNLIASPIEDKLATFFKSTDNDRKNASNILTMKGGADGIEGAGALTVVWASSVGEGVMNNWEELEENEINIYYDLYAREGQAAAYKFLDDMAITLNRRATEERAKEISEAPLLEQIMLNIASVPMNVFGSLPSAYSDIANAVQGKPYNPYSYGKSWQNDASVIRSDTAADIVKATNGAALPVIGTSWGDVYSALMSAADSALGVVTLGKGYTVLMGTGAAQQEMKRLWEQGASESQMVSAGILAGAAEMIFEKVSIDNLFKMKDAKSILGVVKNLLIQGGVEASEEAATEIANTITNAIVMGSQSDWVDAETFAKNVVNAGIGGFISGGAMGGAFSSANYAGYNAQMKQSGQAMLGTDTEKAFRELGTELGTNNRTIGRLANKSGATNLGKLADRISDEVLSKNRAEVRRALMDKGISGKEATRIASYLLSRSELTEAQAAEIAENPAIFEVVEEILNDPNSAVNERTKALLAAQMGITYKSSSEKGNTVSAQDIDIDIAIEDKVSDNGKSALKSNGESIKIDTKNPIATIKDVDGRRTIFFNTDKGKVDFNDIIYASEEDAWLYESFIDINPAIANAIIRNYDGSVPIDTYIRGMREGVILYGMHNFQGVGKDIGKDTYFAELSESDQQFALKLGKSYATSIASRVEGALHSAVKSAEKKAKTEGKTNTPTVRQKGVVRFENGAKAENADQRNAITLAKHLASAMGINIVFYDSTKESSKLRTENNGYYDGKTDTIYLDLQNSRSDKKTIAFTLSHELVHFIKKWSPKKFKVLADFLMEQYGERGINTSAMLSNKMAQYGTKDGDFAFEEMIADACETMLLDSNAVFALAELGKTDMTLLQKIKTHIAQILSKLRNAYKGLAPTSTEAKVVAEMTDSIEQMHKLFEDAIVQATENYQAAQKVGAEITKKPADAEIKLQAKIDYAVDESIRTKGNVSEKYNQIRIDKFPAEIVEMVSAATEGQIDLTAKYIAVNASDLWHEYERHRDQSKETERQQVAFTKETIKDAIAAIYSPDIIESIFASKENPTQRQSFAYAKKSPDGHYIVVEAVGGKSNSNVVPVMILQFTEAKWNKMVSDGKSLGEIFFENDQKKRNALDIDFNKKNRVIAAQFTSKEVIANTPHSPRFNNSISLNSENVNTSGENNSDIRFQKKVEDEAVFNPEGESIDDILTEILKTDTDFQSKYIYFGRFEDSFISILQDNGITVKDLPVVMNYRDAYLAMENKENGKYQGDNINYHNIGIDGMKSAIDEMTKPSAIMKSQKEGKIELALTFKDYKGNTGLIIIALNAVARNSDKYIEAHIVTSVYGRRNIEAYIKKAETEGRLIKNKTEESSQVKAQVQYKSVINDNPSADIIVSQNPENVNTDGIKSQQKPETARGILSNILTNAIDTSTEAGKFELKKLTEYQEKIEVMEREQARLGEITKEIKNIAFTKGSDRSKLNELNDEKIKIQNRLRIYDSQLLRLEAMKPIKDLLEREKALEEKNQGKKITAGMSDSERAEILKSKSVSAPIYRGQADVTIERNISDLESRKRTVVENALIRIADEFNAKGDYHIEDVELEVSFSNQNIRESSHKAVTSPKELAKLLPILSETVKNTVGIETHNNRYFVDNVTKSFHELIGGYIDGDSFIPVRFGIKELNDGKCYLYVVVCQEKIKTEVMGIQAGIKSSSHTPRSVNISIARIAENVNTQNKDLLRYFPDGLLNNEQRKAKNEAISETIEYTNAKNDKAYIEAVESGDTPTAKKILQNAAKAAGYTLVSDMENGNKVYRNNSNVTKSAAVTYDDSGQVIPVSKRFDENKNDIRYQLKESGESPRELLTSVVSSAIDTSTQAGMNELKMLNEYKSKIASIEEIEKRLAEVNAEIKKISFTKGSDRSKLNELNEEKIKLQNRIRRYDSQLLRLEALKPIKDLLEREKVRYRKKADAKGKEALKDYSKGLAERTSRETAKTKLRRLVLDTVKWISNPPKNAVRVPDALKETYAKFLSLLDFSSERALKGGEPTNTDLKMASAMETLANTVERIKKGQSGEGSEAIADIGFLDLPADFPEDLREIAENIKNHSASMEHIVNRMSAEEINNVIKMIRILNKSIRERGNLYANQRYKTANEAGENSTKFLEKMGDKKKTSRMGDFIQWDNVLPYYAFKRFGDAGISIFAELMDAQDKLAFLVDEIQRFSQNTWAEEKIKEWEKDTHNIVLSEDKVITLTTADAMSIYCLARRDNEVGVKHLIGGGVRIIGKTKGNTKEQDKKYTFTRVDLETIAGSLTDKQKEVADKIQEFMSNECAKWGNEISMTRFRTNDFNEKNYFPMESDNENLTAELPEREQANLYRLLNFSATKSLTKNANNRLVIRSIFDVFASHTVDMARLNAFGVAILDYMKWYNYNVKIKGSDGNIETRGVSAAMRSAYGEAANQYVLTLIKDINGKTSDGGMPRFLAKTTKLAKTAAVAGNMSVAALQFTAYPRAAMILSPTALAVGLTKVPKIELCKKYCGIALWKSFGYYDTNIAKSIEEQIKGSKNIASTIIEFTMKGAEMADAITWGALWNACEYDIKRTWQGKTDTDEFYRAVGIKLREVVYATQVVDSVLTRSQIMRKKDGLAQMATAFMSEPTLTANILMDAVFEIEKAKRLGLPKGKAWRHFARAAGVYAFVALITTLVESLIDAIRDDDEDELFKEKYISATLPNLLSNMIPFNKLPIISEISDTVEVFGKGGKYYPSESMSSQWITQTMYAIIAWSNVFDKKDNPNEVYKAVSKTLKAISYITGIPISNVMRDFVAIWNTLIGEINDDLLIV